MKVRIMAILDRLGMKETTRIQGPINQVPMELHQVDLHLHRHIMQPKNILVREEGQIQQILRMATPEMNLKGTADVVVVNQEVVVAIHSRSMYLSGTVTTIIINPKIVTMVEIIIRNQQIMKWTMKHLDTQKRTAKTMTIAKVKKATLAILTAGETKEAIMEMFLKIATMKTSQTKKEVSELETECLKNLIQNNVKTFHLECL